MAIEDEIRQKQFKNATGTAMSFTSINGIGPATAKKIKNADYSIKAPRDIQDMSADELSDKAGISYSRAEKAIRGAGGNPNQSKRDNTGSVSAAGIKQRRGDFMVEFSDEDKARARNDPRSRSEAAVRQDDRKRAPITQDYDQWKDNPGRWDFPGVDTPTQEPKALPKDYKAGGELNTTDPTPQEQGKNTQSYPRKRDAASGATNFMLETEDGPIPASDVSKSPRGEVDESDSTGFMRELGARDVSASPEEITRGVGLGTPSAPGGQAYNALEGRSVEVDRVDQEQKPPESALKRQSIDATKGFGKQRDKSENIMFAYENSDLDVGLPEFRSRVERETRELGMADWFGNSQAVKNRLEKGEEPWYK